MLVVEGGAGAGGCAVVGPLNSPAYMQNSILRCRAKSDGSNSYLCYWLEYLGRSGYIDLVCNKATIPHFTKEKLSAVPMPLPPSKEQRKIAAFLDGECGKINVLRGKVEKQIAALEEYRKSVITEAVTKGIKRGRKMKPSGVEWIGEVPEDWAVRAFRFDFSFSKGLNITKANLVDAGVPVVSYGQIHAKYNSARHLTDRMLRFVPEAIAERGFDSRLNWGDFVFADTSEDIDGVGNFVLNDRDDIVYAGYHDLVARPNDPQNAVYLAYLFQTDAWRSQLRSMAQGIKVFSITQRLFKKVTIIRPALSEQREIAAYLDRKCAAIDSMVAKCREELDRLAEYKKSLIYEYVTGKKEVA